MIADIEIGCILVDILLSTIGKGRHGIAFNSRQENSRYYELLEIIIGFNLIKQRGNLFLHLMAFPFCLDDIPRIQDLCHIAQKLWIRFYAVYRCNNILPLVGCNISIFLFIHD